MLLRCFLPSNSKFNLNNTRFLCSSTTSSSSITPTISVSKQCKSLHHAKLLHQQTTVQGLIDYANITNLIASYISCNSTANAILLLERIPPCPSSVYWWNQLIKRALHLQTPHVVLRLYRRMKTLGWTPDHYTFPFVFKACGDISSFYFGASLHAAVYRSGFISNVFVCNAVVSMYGKSHALIHARKMFDELCSRGIHDLVSSNSIVSAYSHACVPNAVVLLFGEMTMSLDMILIRGSRCGVYWGFIVPLCLLVCWES